MPIYIALGDYKHKLHWPPEPGVSGDISYVAVAKFGALDKCINSFLDHLGEL